MLYAQGCIELRCQYEACTRAIIIYQHEARSWSYKWQTMNHLANFSSLQMGLNIPS